MHKLNSFTDVTTDSEHMRMELLDLKDNFVVPVSRLDGYDYSSDADSSAEVIQPQDDMLLSHFIEWTKDNVMHFRCFAGIDERCERNKPTQSEHVVFMSPQSFRKS